MDFRVAKKNMNWGLGLFPRALGRGFTDRSCSGAPRWEELLCFLFLPISSAVAVSLQPANSGPSGPVSCIEVETADRDRDRELRAHRQ